MIPQFISLIMSLALLGKPSRASDDALHFPFPEGSYPQPFQLNLDESFVEKTLRKVKDYRPTNGLSTEWDMEGPPKETIENVAKYWSTEYDWRAVEKNINTDFHHFATTVSGHGNYTQSIPLHFIHHTSDSDDAIPLLLLHGWPSSFLEWSKVIEPLTQHTGQSFHIVAPDLPGFGLSPAPRQPDLGPREMAKAFDELMHQLGYEKYGIVTTDLGWFVGMWMVNEVEDNIIGHMTDFFLTPPTDSDRARIQSGQASSEETSYITALDNWFTSHWAYATAHGQKPLALGQALGDTPVGLLGWLWDVAHAVGDGYNFGYEQLITDTMMLWIPGPYANMRAYLEIFKVSKRNWAN